MLPDSDRIYDPDSNHPRLNCFCIDAPVVLDSFQTRKAVTLNIALPPSPGNYHPAFRLKGTGHYKIAELRELLSVPAGAQMKKVELLIVIRFDLIYTDGKKDLVEQGTACMVITADRIKSPDSRVKRFQKDETGAYSCVALRKKSYFRAEALADTFGEMLCPETGALIIDLGAFFVVRSMYDIQLLVQCLSDEFSQDGQAGLPKPKRNIPPWGQ